MVLGKNIKMKVKVKVVILKTLPPPSLEQAGSVLLPMVDYSLGGDGGGNLRLMYKILPPKRVPINKR